MSVPIVDNEVAVILDGEMPGTLSFVLGIRSPSRVTISVIDHKVAVILHAEVVRTLTFVVGVGSPNNLEQR